MKLVAAKDFANVPALGLTLNEETTGFVHENHVHKGHRFTIGKADLFGDLKPAEKEIVAQLVVSKCAVIDNPDDKDNKAIIAKIDREAKEDQKQAAAAKKLANVGLPELIGAAVQAALKGAPKTA